jgi:hypothetical protein
MARRIADFVNSDSEMRSATTGGGRCDVSALVNSSTTESESESGLGGL